MRENTTEDMVQRLHRVFSNRNFRRDLEKAKKNWFDVDSDTVLSQLAKFLKGLFLSKAS